MYLTILKRQSKSVLLSLSERINNHWGRSIDVLLLKNSAFLITQIRRLFKK